jgi:PAS domain S-box-containing protein
MKLKYYEALINKSPFGFALHRIMLNDYGQPVDYEFIDANPAYEELTGLKVNNIINRKVTDVLPEIKKNDFNWISFYGKIALHGGEEVFEQYSESLKRWYKVQVYSPEENHFATVFVDITDQKLNEQRYQGLVESQNDLIVRVDANNRFTFVNKAYCKTFGKTSDELLGSDFFPLIHEEDREATAKAMEKLYAPPYRCYLEQRAMTVKGWRWLAWEDNAVLDNTGKIIEVQGVGRDITEFKEKEEAITKQAANLQNLLTHTPAVIYAFTFKDGVPDLHYINENIEQVLGFKPNDFLHNFDMWKSCVHPDDLKTLAEKLQKPEETNLPIGEAYNEYRFRDKNGHYRWLSDRQKSIVNSDGQMEVIGAWVDITDEKEKAEALHKYQSRLSLAQNFAKAGSWEYDIEKGALDWSPECEALFGIEKDSFEGSFEAFLERVHPDDRDYVKQTNDPIVELKEGVSLDYVHRIITPAGVTKWVKESAGVVRDAEGKASHIIGLVMDITERKMAENAMENEKKLRDIVDNIEGIFWLRSSDRFDMLYVSPAYEEIFGMSTGSLYENPASFTDVVHPEDSERINKAYEKFMKTGIFKQEYRIIRPDGAMRWIATRAFPVKNDQGEIIRYAGISEDTTKRKLTEQSEREKTNNLNATIAALPDILFFMSKNGTYLDVHTIEPEKLLAPKEEIIGHKISEFFNEAETAKQLQLYKECIDEQSLKTYDYSIELNGKTLYFEARLSPVDDQKLLAIVRDVSAQKLHEENLIRQTKLQKLLTEVSNTYIDISAADLDKAINNSLKELGEFMGADRCYVFEHDYDLKVTSNTHEWCAEGIEPQIDNLKETPFELFTEWLEVHQKGESFYIPDVFSLPIGHSHREILEPQGIKSLISVPLMDQGKTIGFIGFDSVKKHHTYTETEENLLDVFAKMLVSVKRRLSNERALAESEKKFQTIFRTSPYGIVLSRPDDGKLIEVNDIFMEISGFKREEVVDKTTMELQLWNNPSDRNRILDVIAGKGKLKGAELTFRNKYGNKLTCLVSAQLIKLNQEMVLLTSINDITEKKEAFDLIQKNEERFRQVAETSQAVIWETDDKGLFTYVSPMAEKIWGYTPEDLIGRRNYFDLHPEKGRMEFKRITKELLTEKQAFRDLVNPVEKPGGELAWMSTNGLVIYNDEMQPAGFRGSDQNITEIRKLLDDLTAAKNKAEESDRLKSAFLATISHELRTPLNHIIGFSSLISDMTEEEETKNFADIIQESGTAFLGMIEDIFDLAFIDESEVSLRKTTFKGMELFMEAKNSLDELLHKAGKSEQVKLQFVPDHALLQSFITGDRQKIMQVLTNLFKNAVKFTAQGTIEFGMLSQNEQEIVLYVKDTGIGIPAEMQQAIFDFFRQVEDSHTRQHDGLGIGLSISKKIAETLHASIRVESEHAKGSTFSLFVPVEINNFENKTGNLAESANSLLLTQQTILIAEDDPTSLMLIMKIMKDIQVNLLTAENGQQALELFRANPDIKLVLMDLKMPVMDGYEATRQIKSLRPEIPVVALTAYALTKDKPKAIEAGCDALVTKPVNKTVLFKTIQSFLG